MHSRRFFFHASIAALVVMFGAAHANPNVATGRGTPGSPEEAIREYFGALDRGDVRRAQTLETVPVVAVENSNETYDAGALQLDRLRDHVAVIARRGHIESLGILVEKRTAVGAEVAVTVRYKKGSQSRETYELSLERGSWLVVSYLDI